jgi:hypothetical protein
MSAQETDVAWLYEFFGDLRQHGHDTCLARLAEANVSRVLRSCLAAGRAQGTYLADVCRRSYVHPNGFVKLDLARTSSWALRLHVWSSGVSDELNDPHDHRGFLVSRVLRGAITNNEFEVRPKVGGATSYLRYKDVLRDSVHQLHADGRT